MAPKSSLVLYVYLSSAIAAFSIHFQAMNRLLMNLLTLCALFKVALEGLLGCCYRLFNLLHLLA